MSSYLRPPPPPFRTSYPFLNYDLRQNSHVYSPSRTWASPFSFLVVPFRFHFSFFYLFFFVFLLPANLLSLPDIFFIKQNLIAETRTRSLTLSFSVCPRTLTHSVTSHTFVVNRPGGGRVKSYQWFPGTRFREFRFRFLLVLEKKRGNDQSVRSGMSNRFLQASYKCFAGRSLKMLRGPHVRNLW